MQTLYSKVLHRRPGRLIERNVAFDGLRLADNRRYAALREREVGRWGLSGSARDSKIKGVAFIEILRWYSRTHGRKRLLEAVEDLPPDLRLFITDSSRETLGLLAGTWYPMPLITTFFRHMAKDLPPSSVRTLAQDAVQASVGATLSGVYKAIIRVLVTPKMVADHYQKIWSLYHTTGRCHVAILGPRLHEMRLTEWPAHDSFICLMNIYATKLLLETIGCKNVHSTRVRCLDRGDTSCAYSLTW